MADWSCTKIVLIVCDIGGYGESFICRVRGVSLALSTEQ